MEYETFHNFLSKESEIISGSFLDDLPCTVGCSAIGFFYIFGHNDSSLKQ
jgi:hypothetical protein